MLLKFCRAHLRVYCKQNVYKIKIDNQPTPFDKRSTQIIYYTTLSDDIPRSMKSLCKRAFDTLKAVSGKQKLTENAELMKAAMPK